MKIQWNQRLISSFLSYLDYKIQKEGEAFINTTGYFYPVSSNYNGLYAYSSPFRQLCSDTSIPNCNVLTGCYLGNTFITVGQSGLASVNYPKGALFFNTIPAVRPSGTYSYKECSIELTDKEEYKLLFETEYVANSKFNQVLSGLALDVKTTPAIFVKIKNIENEPFAFSRIDANTIDIRLVVVANSEFQKQGLCNILANLNMTEFKIVSGQSALTFNGDYTGRAYNYTGQTFSNDYWPLILSSQIRDIPSVSQYTDIKRSVALCDITVSTVMRHP